MQTERKNLFIPRYSNIMFRRVDKLTDEEDILHLCSTGEPDEWVEKLVSKANENGGGDNITVVAILQDKNGGGER